MCKIVCGHLKLYMETKEVNRWVLHDSVPDSTWIIEYIIYNKESTKQFIKQTKQKTKRNKKAAAKNQYINYQKHTASIVMMTV